MSDLFERVDNFIKETRFNYENGVPISSELNDLMFSLHNEAWFGILRETSKRCSSCQQRCYKNLKNWWNDNGGKFVD